MEEELVIAPNGKIAGLIRQQAKTNYLALPWNGNDKVVPCYSADQARQVLLSRFAEGHRIADQVARSAEEAQP